MRLVYKTTHVRVKQKNPTLVQAGLEGVQKQLPLTIYIWQQQLVLDCEAKKQVKTFLKTPKQNVVIEKY